MGGTSTSVYGPPSLEGWVAGLQNVELDHKVELGKTHVNRPTSVSNLEGLYIAQRRSKSRIRYPYPFWGHDTPLLADSRISLLSHNSILVILLANLRRHFNGFLLPFFPIADIWGARPRLFPDLPFRQPILRNSSVI